MVSIVCKENILSADTDTRNKVSSITILACFIQNLNFSGLQAWGGETDIMQMVYDTRWRKLALGVENPWP